MPTVIQSCIIPEVRRVEVSSRGTEVHLAVFQDAYRGFLSSNRVGTTVSRAALLDALGAVEPRANIERSLDGREKIFTDFEGDQLEVDTKLLDLLQFTTSNRDHRTAHLSRDQAAELHAFIGAWLSNGSTADEDVARGARRPTFVVDSTASDKTVRLRAVREGAEVAVSVFNPHAAQPVESIVVVGADALYATVDALRGPRPTSTPDELLGSLLERLQDALSSCPEEVWEIGEALQHLSELRHRLRWILRDADPQAEDSTPTCGAAKCDEPESACDGMGV